MDFGMDQPKNERKILIGITSNVIIDRVGLQGYDMISKAGFECIDFNMQRGFYNVKDNSYNAIETGGNHCQINKSG